MVKVSQLKYFGEIKFFSFSIFEALFSKALFISILTVITIGCKTEDKNKVKEQIVNNKEGVKILSKELEDNNLIKDDSIVLSNDDLINFPIKKDSIYYEDSKVNCSVQINFFEVEGLGDTLIEAKVNDRLRHAFGINKKSNICQENTELGTEYRVTHFSKKLLSVFISQYYHYADAPHGDRNTFGVNLNLENGKDVQLKDIIDEKSIDSLNNYLIKVLLKKYYKNDSSYFYKDHYKTQLFNPNFIINQKGMVFFFKGMSETDGYQEVGLPFKNIYDKVKKEYSPYFD